MKAVSENYKYGARKVALLAVMTAMGLITFLIENAFPPLFFPGAKLGLSNVFSLVTLLLYGLPEALLVVVARTLLGSLFAGNFSLVLYSLTAGVCATAVSRLLLWLLPKISVVCVSVVSAVVHNTAQLLVYCLLTQTMLVFSYSPYLLLLGVLAGLAVGLIVYFIIKAIPLSFFEKESKSLHTNNNYGGSNESD